MCPLEMVVDLFGTLADAVGPVVEDDDPFGVVVALLGGIVDDHWQVKPVIGFQTDVGVCPVGAGMREVNR